MFKSLFKTSLSPFPAQSNPLAITKNLLSTVCSAPLSHFCPHRCRALSHFCLHTCLAFVSLLSAPLSRFCLFTAVLSCLAFVCTAVLSLSAPKISNPKKPPPTGAPRRAALASSPLERPERAETSCADTRLRTRPGQLYSPRYGSFCHLIFTQLYRLSSSPLQNAAKVQYFHRPRYSSD